MSVKLKLFSPQYMFWMRNKENKFPIRNSYLEACNGIKLDYTSISEMFFMANLADTDQMLCSLASYPDLHCLRPPDKSAYWKITFLNICCGYSKETVLLSTHNIC